jgi:hypothetical protein
VSIGKAKRDLALYRIKQAEESIDEAKFLFGDRLYTKLL